MGTPRSNGRTQSKKRKPKSQRRPATKKAARAEATKRPGLTEVRDRLTLDRDDVRQ